MSRGPASARAVRHCRAPRRWSTLVAVVSWLGLGTVTTAVRAQSDRGPIAGDEIRAMLARLDSFFARGDLAGYLACFLPDHPGTHAMRRRQLEPVFASGQRLSRTSQPITEPRQLGDRTVVRVGHELRCANGTNPELRLREDTMLALRHDANGRIVPTFEVEIPVQAACIRNDLFHCPPCNYEIGGTPGWLCVPSRTDRARAVEAATFYLIGTDVACDVSVLADPDAPAAADVARQLGESLSAREPSAVPGEVTAWLPAAHRATPPAGLAGARLEVVLPQDFVSTGGGRAIFHVATFGGLQHVLFVRGSAAALRHDANTVQQLLDTYRLLEKDADRALAAAQAVSHHTGGSIEGSTYRNEPCGVTFTGPAEWKVEQRCGGAAFRIVWKSPRGGRLHLVGYRVPAGMTAWCTVTADRWLRQLCASAGLAVAADDPARAWTQHPTCGGPSRTYVCEPNDRRGEPAARRIIRLMVRDDLLLVVDSQTCADADEQAVQSALPTLRIE